MRQVLLVWAAVDGADSYGIYLSGSFTGSFPSLSKGMNKAAGDGEDTLIAIVAAPQTSYNFTSYPWDGEQVGLSNDCVTYPIKIVSWDSYGNKSTAETTSQDVNPDADGSLDTSLGGGDGFVQVAAVGEFTDVDVLSGGTIIALRSGAERSLMGFDDDGVELWEVPFDGSLGAALDLADAATALGLQQQQE